MSNEETVIAVRSSGSELIASIEYHRNSFEITLEGPGGDEVVEATVEVREGHDGDANVIQEAYIDTLELDPAPEDDQLRASMVERIRAALEAEGFETKD